MNLKKITNFRWWTIVNGYADGLPQSDVMCNKEIKFGLFLKKALGESRLHHIGHYVKLASMVKIVIEAARDKAKNQSYFLWTLGQYELSHVFSDWRLFEIRSQAYCEHAKLPTAKKILRGFVS